MSIIYVGGQIAGRSNPTSATAITFDFTGSGGVDTVPRAGDLVIVCAVTGSAAGNPAMAVTTPSGYTPLGQLNQSAVTADTSMDVSYKRMGATPDTTVTIPGTGNNAFGEAYTIQCFRGVDSVTPMDVTPVSGGATGTGRPDPASITPITPGAWVVICGGGAAGTGADYVAPANYTTNFLETGGVGADTTDAMVGSGYRSDWSSGPENPAAYTGGTTGANDSWASYTLALRPEDPFGPSSPELRAVSKKSIVSRLLDALTPNLLTSTLSAAPPPEDIYLPRTGSIFQRLRRSNGVFAQAIPNLLLTTLAVAGVADTIVPRHGDVPRQSLRPRSAIQQPVTPNLLATTLAPSAQDPFKRGELPARTSRRIGTRADETRNLLTTTLAVAAQDPFKTGDPAQLIRRARREAPFDVERNLVRLTTPVPNPAVQQEAQPVQPRPRRAPEDEAKPNLSTSTLFVAAPADPFKPEQSPTPRRRRPPPQPEAIRNTLTVPGYEVLGVGSTPVDSGIIVNRRRDARLPARDSETRNLLTSTLFVPAAPDEAVGSIPIDSSNVRFRFRAKREFEPQANIALLTAPPPSLDTIIPRQHALPTRLKRRAPVPVQDVTSGISLLTAPVVNPQVRPEITQRLLRRRPIQEPEAPNLLATPGLRASYVLRLASFGQAGRRFRVGRPEEPTISPNITTAPVVNPQVKVETPLPVRPKKAWQDPQHQSRIALLTAVAPLPKIQVEPALPVRSKKSPQEHVSPNLINTTLTTAPAVETITNRGKISAAVRPKRARLDPEHQSRIALLTATPPPADVVIVRSRVDGVPRRSRLPVSEEIPNILATTLGEEFQVRVPIINPIPTKRQLAPQDDPTRSLAIATAPVVNPQVKVETALGVRPKKAHQDPLIPNRIALVTVPPIFPQVLVETPLGVRPKRAKIDPEHQSRISLLTAIAPLPQVQEETPLFPPVRPAKLDLEIQSMLALLDASFERPQVKVETPLPVRPKRAILDPERQNLRLLPFVAQAQIQVEIPLPVRPKRAWQDPNIENRIPLQLSAIPEFQVEDPLFPRPPRAIQDPEIQSRISLLTWIPPLPPVVCDTSVPPRRIHAVWIPDQFNVPILELITNAYRPDIELTLNINRTVAWNLEINRTVEESTEINSEFDMGLDLTGE